MHMNIDTTKKILFGNNLYSLHQEDTRKGVFSVIYSLRIKCSRCHDRLLHSVLNGLVVLVGISFRGYCDRTLGKLEGQP